MKKTALVLLIVLGWRDPFLLPRVPLFAAGQATRDGPCTIPNLIGQDRAAAVKLLTRADLSLGHVESRESDAPAGVVIDQRPQACGDGTYNRTVDIVVSSGQRQAQPKEPEVRKGGGSRAAEVGVAVGIAAAAAILAARANADKTVEVPDLVNKPVTSASDVLKKARLRMGEIAQRNSPTVAAGLVIEQSPAAGSRAKRGDAVTVTVSQGRPTTVVPVLTGHAVGEAESIATNAQLRLVATNRPQTDNPRLVVRSQVPEAGTSVFVGAAVGVTLDVPQQPADPAPTPPPAPAVSVPPAPVGVPPNPSQGAPDRTIATPRQLGPPASQPVAQPASSPPAPPPPATPAVPVPTPAAPVPTPATPASAQTPVAAPPEPQTPVDPWIVIALPATLVRAWPWLLLLVGALALRRKWRRRAQSPASVSEPPQPNPTPPRVTLIPRLDAGRQVVTVLDSRDSHSFELSYWIDPGAQELLQRDSPISQGARS